MSFFDSLLNFDHRVFLAVNHLNGSWLDYFLGWPTHLGENSICLILVFLFMRIWDREHLIKRFFFYVSIVAVTGILVHFLKHGVDRPRPYQYFNHDFQSGALRLKYLYKMHLSKSFPSGHAALTFMTALVLNHLYRNRLLFLYPLAVLIAFSRIYVGAHFPSDVAGGILLGAAVGGMAIVAHRRFERPSQIPKRKGGS